MTETGREIGNGTCCLCLSEDESTFHTNSIMKSLPLHEMVDFCLGIQVHQSNNMAPLYSTTICNECVLNINNFYVFKKRVFEAQELINSLNSKDDLSSDEKVEYVEEEMINNYETENSEEDVDDPIEMIEVQNQNHTLEKLPVNRTNLKSNSLQNRPNESSPAKTTNKKTKGAASKLEKVRIQMNECLICPEVLSDILQLKDHIETHTDKCDITFR